MTEQLPTPDPAENAPLATGWRIAIGGIAVIIVAVMGWQLWGNQTPAAPTTPPAPTSAATSEASTVATSVNPTVASQESPEALFKLGNDYYKAGQLDQAVAAFKKAIELKSDYVAAYANLGAVYYTQQNLSLAEETYRQAIKLSPDDGDLLYNLSAIYIQEALASNPPDQEKLSLAATQIDKAISLDPTLAAPYYGRGVIKSYTGDVAGAIKDFEKFLELDDGSDPKATSNATTLLKQLRQNSGQ